MQAGALAYPKSLYHALHRSRAWAAYNHAHPRSRSIEPHPNDVSRAATPLPQSRAPGPECRVASNAGKASTFQADRRRKPEMTRLCGATIVPATLLQLPPHCFKPSSAGSRFRSARTILRPFSSLASPPLMSRFRCTVSFASNSADATPREPLSPTISAFSCLYCSLMYWFALAPTPSGLPQQSWAEISGQGGDRAA